MLIGMHQASASFLSGHTTEKMKKMMSTQPSDWAFLLGPITLGIGAPLLLMLLSGGRGDGARGRGIVCGVRPKWQPPAWVFSVVWPVLYLLLGIQGMLQWRRAGRSWSPGLTLWSALTASLLVWWPVFSLWACAPLLAFLSLLAIAALCWYIVIAMRAYLLVPLAAWLAFACVLSAQAVPPMRA